MSIAVAGRAAWTVVLAAWVVSALGSGAFWLAARRHPEERFPTYVLRALGPVLGRVALLYLAGVPVLVAAVDLILIFESVDDVFYDRTPFWALAAAVLVVAGYAAWTGWRSLAMVSPLLLLAVGATLSFLWALLVPKAEAGYLWPPIDPGQFRWEPVAVWLALVGFHYPVVLPFLFPLAARKKRFFPAFAAGGFAGAAVILVSVLFVVAVVGPEAARELGQPYPDITAVLTLPRSFFDRPEHLARLSLNVNALMAVAVSLLAGAEMLAALVSARNPDPFIPVVAGGALGVASAAHEPGLRQPLMAATGGLLYSAVPLLLLLAVLPARPARSPRPGPDSRAPTTRRVHRAAGPFLKT
ncbi:hypothetical protein caldi_34870 [Caldinitratiruptor microaerophilus]|uniref:Uncharacterized protein n=1 Tax=Caldinitratiruptor microaerophilus TaxID=671077 RepID=A0AA35CQP0_9FIRM|nr:hypothetical protein caldi_34870 [Caldinitratiruptor microaerophilus]